MNDSFKKDNENTNNNSRQVKYVNLVYALDEKNKASQIISNDNANGTIFIPKLIYFDGIEFIVTNIKTESFKYSQLKSIQFPSDSEVKVIEKDAFIDSQIESIIIPPSLSVLEDGWCSGTKHLKKFHFYRPIIN